jgi:hypothetical protein
MIIRPPKQRAKKQPTNFQVTLEKADHCIKRILHENHLPISKEQVENFTTYLISKNLDIPNTISKINQKIVAFYINHTLF